MTSWPRRIGWMAILLAAHVGGVFATDVHDASAPTDDQVTPATAQAIDPDMSTLSESDWRDRITASDLATAERWRDTELRSIGELHTRAVALADRQHQTLLDERPATTTSTDPIHADGADRPNGADTIDDWQTLDQQLLDIQAALNRHQSRLTSLDSHIEWLLLNPLRFRGEQLLEQEQRLTGSDNPLLLTRLAQTRRSNDATLEQAQALIDERKMQASYQQAAFEVAGLLRETRLRLALDSSGTRSGRWLWSKRRSLEQPALMQQHLTELRQQREQASLGLIEASQRLRAWTPTVSGAGDDNITRLRAESDQLDAQRPHLLQQRIESLQGSEQALRERLDSLRELWQILDRQLLWVPSHGPFSWERNRHLHTAFLYGVILPPNPGQTLARWQDNIRAHPLRVTLGVLLVGALVALRWRTRRRLLELAEAIRPVARDHFIHTVTALFWTIVAALPWAVALWLLGGFLADIDTWIVADLAIGQAMKALALPAFCFSFLYQASADQGLFRAHLRWPDCRCDLLRRRLPVMAWLLLPLYFIADVAIARNISFMVDGVGIDTPARMALLLLCGYGAVSIWRLLAPDGLWRQADGQEAHGLRTIVRMAMASFLIALAALVLLGYIYTAFALIGALLKSLGVVIVVALVHGLMARWFLIGERRLFLRRQQQRLDDAGDDAKVDSAGIDDELPLLTINAQSRRLLAAARLVLVVVGLAWVWADVLQAFMRLDEITLWHFVQTGMDGHPERVAVSVMSLFLGLTTLTLTFVAARNLPGLIEIGLQPYHGIDAPSRYAIISLARYAIVITGVLVGLSLLGLRWSQLQWMAAALTVGLGFGLQEIFANFVSGLILLFERPFRVGDIITVGELSGRVTRIRTRATTILDFDNKEIVIPNKSFITGQLVNWTLSDTVTRITIQVGIVHGSDLDQVRALLLRAARENPRVLAEPAPNCVLLTFGERALDVHLRVYVGTIADRIPVQDELNTRISQLLSEHRIEVAFRPRDRAPNTMAVIDDDIDDALRAKVPPGKPDPAGSDAVATSP